MTTNAWSRRGHAGPNSTPHTTIFRPSAASFTPSSQIMGDGEDGEYYPPGVAPFVPPDTPPTGQRTLPAASGANTTPPARTPPRATSVLSPWESEQVRATWGREESAVPGSGISPTGQPVTSRMSIIGDAWTGSADIFAPGPGVTGAGSPGQRTASSSQQDMALVVAGTALSPVASSSESASARELAAAIMGGGRRVTPGHEMTWAPPTPSPPTKELPFGNRCVGVVPATPAVLKLSSVGYGITKAEIIASIGESIPIVTMPRNSGTYAIHIMFDRQSAKSGDCYIEFPSASAIALVMNSRKNTHDADGKVTRMISGRRVYLHPSTHEELMQEVFPKAKCVTWHGQEPVIHPPNDIYTSGFAGFVTSEELVLTNRWANEPHKSKYTGTHPQRPYESLITLLFKFPWFSTPNFTLTLRNQIHTTTLKMLASLLIQVTHNIDPYRLSQALLEELLTACLECPAFSERQRAACIDAVQGFIVPSVYVTPLAPYWPFETICRREGVDEKRLWMYVELIRSVSASVPASTMAVEGFRGGRGEGRMVMESAFGNVDVPWPVEKGGMAFSAAAWLEWSVIGALLQRAEEMVMKRHDSPHEGLLGWN